MYLRKLDDAGFSNRNWILFMYLYKHLLNLMASDFFSLLPVPPNGLVVYCGTIVTEEGKEKKVNIDFEPFKPINTSLYLCDNKFHTEVRTFTWLLPHIFFL